MEDRKGSKGTLGMMGDRGGMDGLCEDGDCGDDVLVAYW